MKNFIHGLGKASALTKAGFLNSGQTSRVRRWVLLATFLILVSPTVISYSPYPLSWDESYYLGRVICTNQAAYRFSMSALKECLAGTLKGPIMGFVNLPWGPVGGTERGIGLSFIGLTILIWILVVLTYRVCLRGGIPTGPLLLAAVTICLSPLLRASAGAMMTDTLLGWCVALGLLLIPLEYARCATGFAPSVWRGLLWSLVINVGMLSKVTFAFFLCLIGVVLIAVRERYSGEYPLRCAFGSSILGSLPAIIIWRYNGLIFLNVAAMSAWGLAKYWSIPGMTASGYVKRYLFQLGLALIPLAVLSVLFIRGIIIEKQRRLGRILPVLIILLYLGVAARSQNRDPRFTIPVMIALPLCLAWTTTKSAPRDTPAGSLIVALVVGALFCIPMVRRPDIAPINSAGDLLTRLQNSGVKPVRVIIATDGFAYNIDTFLLARQLRNLRAIQLDTLVYDAAKGHKVDEGFRRIDAADYVLFLKPGLTAGADWTRVNAADYRAHCVSVGSLESPDISPVFEVYAIRHSGAQ